MTTQTVTTFFALLAVLCEAAVVAALVLVIAARVSDGGRRALDRVRVELAPTGLWLAFSVAATATLGSLYLSEVAGFLPCRFCWYQRIAMYPLSLLLGIAAVRRDRDIRVYAVPLACIGAALSIYHVLVQRFPNLESSSCDPANPCTLIWVQHFGYLTIPAMALSGFAAIVAILGLTPGPDGPDVAHERGATT